MAGELIPQGSRTQLGLIDSLRAAKNRSEVELQVQGALNGAYLDEVRETLAHNLAMVAQRQAATRTEHAIMLGSEVYDTLVAASGGDPAKAMFLKGFADRGAEQIGRYQ